MERERERGREGERGRQEDYIGVSEIELSSILAIRSEPIYANL